MKRELNESGTDVVVGLAVGVPLMVILGALAGTVGSVAGALTGMAVAWCRGRNMAALQARLKDNAAEWDVKINDVKVGTISDAEYAAIALQTYQSWRVHWGQAVNLLAVATRIVAALFWVTPIFLFWVAVAVLWWAEPGTVSAIAEQADQGMVREVARALVPILLMGSALVFGGATLLGRPSARQFGYINVFASDTAWRIRRRLKVPTDGLIYLEQRRAPDQPENLVMPIIDLY